MRSRFPGMDPYLERHWNDVHGRLLVYANDELNLSNLPAPYRATFGVYFVRVDPGRSDPLRRLVLEVRDASDADRLVTAVELWAPESKMPGDGLDQLLQRRAEYRAAGVNRVEIDLLRRGLRTIDVPDHLLSVSRREPYHVVIHRAEWPTDVAVAAISLRDPLPVIGIPLRPGEADVPLALQPLVDRVYRNGRFPVRYGDPCEPPLAGDDDAWAAGLTAAGPAAGGART